MATTLNNPSAPFRTGTAESKNGQTDKTASPFARPNQNQAFSTLSGKPGDKPASSFFSQRQTQQDKPGSIYSAIKGTDKPTSLYRPRQAENRPGAEQAGQRPFTSLRTQTQTPDANSGQSRFSGFAKPAAAAGNATAKSAVSAPRPFGVRAQGEPTPAPGSMFRSNAPAAARSTSPFRKDLQISDEEFILLRDFIYQQCGIFIAENRKYLVENRLSNRLKELNLKNYNEYYNFLRFDANRRQELTKLFEVVTTNETSFFRNPPQLDVFQRIVLTQTLEQARKSGLKKLRIWSAGCSTGEEPYTLAIILQETLKSDIGNWDIKITANDLSEAVLAAARRGIYNEYALRTTPKEMVEKYFKKEGNVYKLDSALKRMVSFGQINLSDKEMLKRVEKSQIVFCRNVIIYFDDEMKRKVINAFYDNLLPGGVLIIGHSESLHNISRAFTLEHHKGAILYRKTS